MKVYIIAAITIDGFIGQSAGHNSLEWTSPEDKQQYRETTIKTGVMVMGSRTFDTIGRALPNRKSIVYTSRPEAYAGIENVETTNETPADLIRRLESEGHDEVAICGGGNIYAQFMRAGVVDELQLTVEPIAFGRGVPLFDGELEARLELAKAENLNDNTLKLTYRVL